MRTAATTLLTGLVCAFISSTSTQAAPPPTPGNLQPAWLFGEVMLTWNDVPGVTGYNVYRYDTTNVNWAVIATNVAVPRYRDVGIYDPQNYQVTAVNGDGESAPAGPVLAQESGDWFYINLNQYNWAIYDTVAAFPNITVSLVAGADAMLEVGTTWSNFTHFAWDTNYATSHSLTVSNLTPGTHYYARITSVAATRAGVSGWFDFTTIPSNQPPYVQSQTYSIYEDPYMPLEFWLSAWDPDFGQQVTKTIVSGPSHGTLVQNNPWEPYRYTPNTNFFGTDTITFVASDGMVTSQPGTITIEVWPWNDYPVPLSQSVEAYEDTPLTITPQANDVEGDTVVSVQIVQYPTNGWIWTDGPVIHYNPSPNSTRADFFKFNVCDSGGACSWDPASISIDIVPVNDAPEASDVFVNAHAEATFHGSFSVRDLEGDALSCEVVSGPANGTVTVTGTNFTYTPTPGYANFNDNFRYRALDGGTNSPEARVYVWVGNTNTRPVSTDQIATVVNNRDWWFLLDTVDPDNDQLQVRLLTAPTNGIVQFYGISLTYHSASNYVGPDFFSYEVFDGVATGNVANVTLDVIANRPPVANPMQITLPEEWTADFTLSGSDPDGDGVYSILLSNPTHGTLRDIYNFWPFVGPQGHYQYTPAPNFTGVDSFTFTVNDGLTNGTVGTVTFTVTPINDAPVVYGTNLTTTANTPLNFTLAALDVDGDPLTFEIISPTNGVLSGSTPNMTFTPQTNWIGTNIVRFRVTDGTLWSGWATNKIVVTPAPNRAPIAQNQSVMVTINSPLPITLGASDPDGHALTFTIIVNPAHGSVSGSGANRTYTPAANYLGPDVFAFRASDPFGLSATGTVSITVYQPNRAPVGQNRTIDLHEDWILYFGISASDADGDSLTYRIVTPPSHGTLTIESSYQSMQYRGFTNYNGQDSFTWVANDGHVDSAVYTVTLNLIPMNDAPTATNQVVSAQEDTPVSIVPQAGDIDGDALTFTVTVEPAHGTATVNSGAFLYSPAANFNGTDWFQYQARDASNAVATAIITVTVGPVDDPPTANPANITTAEDTTAWLTLSGSDPDGGSLTYTIVSGPPHGSLMGTPPIVGYTPAANYNGSDSFEFRVTDGTGNSSTATVSVTVTAVNDAPVATPQSVSTTEDTPATITLLGSDVDGDTLSSSVASQPAHGSVQLQSGAWVYVPAANYNGPDSFTFTVSDGSAVSGAATVNVTVTAVNDAPTADAQSLVTDEDVALNLTLTGADIDGDALSFIIVAGPTHGALSGSGANLIYTPAANFNGSDGFTFKVSDGNAESADAVVNISVLPVNDAPVASAQPVTFAEDSVGTIPVTVSDVDGDTLSPIIITAASHGAVGNWNGQSWTYLPNANYNGADSFTFQVSDGTTTSASVTVAITVTPVNDAPVGLPQGVDIDEDTPLSFAPNASDVDGDTIGFIITTAPLHGTVTIDNGQMTYAPNLNFSGEDSLAYRPTDGSATGEVAYVVFNVRPVNDAPVAAPQAVTAQEDSSKTITLGGSDVEGSALSFSIVTGPAHGTLSGAAPNLVYTPAANYNGPDSFVFRVNDGALDGAPTAVTLSVTAVNDAPMANGQSVSTAYNTAVSITLTGSDVEGSGLAYTVLTAPANGTLSGTAPNLTFTPNVGWSGVTSFTFKVNDGALDSTAATVSITVAPPTAVPAAPSGLTATGVSQTQINLAWNDNSANEDGFKIERSNNGSSWTQIGTVGPNVRNFSSTGLSANKTYYYRVRAYNVLGDSAYSNTTTGKTLK
jgi:hypothetical protein